MDKAKFTNVTFCDLEKASKFINDPFFHSLDEFSENTFEVSLNFSLFFPRMLFLKSNNDFASCSTPNQQHSVVWIPYFFFQSLEEFLSNINFTGNSAEKVSKIRFTVAIGIFCLPICETKNAVVLLRCDWSLHWPKRLQLAWNGHWWVKT